ncbi:helix-turn-helix domain-containing protein [Deferribacteres bacterium DY0037]
MIFRPYEKIGIINLLVTVTINVATSEATKLLGISRATLYRKLKD